MKEEYRKTKKKYDPISTTGRPLSLFCILIRKVTTLYLFLGKLCEQSSMKFGLVEFYVEQECRKINKKQNKNELWLNFHHLDQRAITCTYKTVEFASKF